MGTPPEETLLARSNERVVLTSNRVDSGEALDINPFVYDALYRPRELEGNCMWDMMCDYSKVKLSKSKLAGDDEGIGESLEENDSMYAYLSHCVWLKSSI